MSAYTTRIVDGEAAFAPYLVAWEALVAAEPRPALEHHAAWLPIEARAKPGSRPVRVLLFRDQVLVGGGAFLLRPWQWECRFAYRRVARFPMRMLDVCGEGFIVPGDDPRGHEAILAAVSRSGLGFDLVFFESLPMDCGLSRVVDAGATAGLRIYIPRASDPHWLLRLPPTIDAYLASLPGERRLQLKRRAKKLEKDKGPITIDRLVAPGDVSTMLRDAGEVSRLSWQGTQLDQVIEANATEAAKLRAHAERGWLRAYVLRSAGRPIAFVQGAQSDGVFYYDRLGYDPDFGRYAPGTVLLYRLIEDLYAFQTPSVLDFGTGHNEYKRRYGNEEFEARDVWLLRPSIYVGAARLLRASLMQTEARLREVVKRLGVDDKVRRVLRRVGRKGAGTPTTGPGATPGATPGGLQTGAPGSAADDEN